MYKVYKKCLEMKITYVFIYKFVKIIVMTKFISTGGTSIEKLIILAVYFFSHVSYRWKYVVF